MISEIVIKFYNEFFQQYELTYIHMNLFRTSKISFLFLKSSDLLGIMKYL